MMADNNNAAIDEWDEVLLDNDKDENSDTSGQCVVESATKHLLSCIEKKPVRYTAPRIVIPLVQFRKFMLRLKNL